MELIAGGMEGTTWVIVMTIILWQVAVLNNHDRLLQQTSDSRAEPRKTKGHRLVAHFHTASHQEGDAHVLSIFLSFAESLCLKG